MLRHIVFASVLVHGHAQGEPSDFWCPNISDLVVDQQDANAQVNLSSRKLTITGGARVSTKASYDILGGYVKFDLDLQSASPGVISNVHAIAAELVGGSYTKSSYCEGQGGVGGMKPNVKFCPELDIIRATGSVSGVSSLYTVPGGEDPVQDPPHPNCNNLIGCNGFYTFSKPHPPVGGNVSKPLNLVLHVESRLSALEGWTTRISDDGIHWQTVYTMALEPPPNELDLPVILESMKTTGVVISSAASGLETKGAIGNIGDLRKSQFSVANLIINGRHVAGPKPTACPSPYPPTYPPSSASAIMV
jgi:hypothetical protein